MRDRVVVVTGSTRGIGLAVARELAAQGAQVVLHGRDTHAVQEAVDAIRSTGGRAIGIAADFSKPSGPSTLIGGALGAHGRIDLLINNAARSAPRGPAWTMGPSEHRETIETNLTAAFGCSRALVAWAIPRGATARIVDISTGATSTTPAHSVDYLASKHGLEGLTRALARDVYGSGVTVVGLQLGPHQTELARAIFPEDAFARLPPATEAVKAIVLAATQPAALVHGRVLAAWRLTADPEGETLLAQPRVGLPPIETGEADLLRPPFGPSPKVRAALRAFAESGAVDRLPDPSSTALREALSLRHDVKADGVTLGSGVSELLDRIFGLFARPGEAVIANTPSWPVFPHLAAKHGLGWCRVPYRLDGARADHDVRAIAEAVHGTVRLVYLVSPGNPTGAAIDERDFVALLAALPPQVTIVVDEAYGDYVERPSALRAARFIGRTDHRIIVLRTFSKLHGLASLRLGYALSSPAMAARLAAAALPFGVSTMAQLAALAALDDPEHERRTFDHNLRERARIELALDERGLPRLASDAPFLLAFSREPQYFDRYALWPVGSAPENDRRIEDLRGEHGGEERV